MNYKFPMTKDTISKQDLFELSDWIKKNPKLTMGDLTKEFESKWSKYISVNYSVFLNSGSSADFLMAQSGISSGKIKKGDKIIVPACGWSTTISSITQSGLEPIMVDADPKDFNLNLDDAEKICEKHDIKGAIIVHPLGVPGNKEKILKFKKKYKLFLMEDCCASVGAKFEDNTRIGTIGDVSSFSFYYGHQLSTIEGGMVCTNDDEIYQNLLMLRSHGWLKDNSKEFIEKVIATNPENVDKTNFPFNFIIPGFNLRPTEINSFLGIKQLEKADVIFKKRNSNHLRYFENLHSRYKMQDFGNNWPVSLHVGILAENYEKREKILRKLSDEKVEFRTWSHGNLGKHPFWIKKYDEFSGKNSDKIYSSGFIVPSHPYLNNDEIDTISEIILNVK